MLLSFRLFIIIIYSFEMRRFFFFPVNLEYHFLKLEEIISEIRTCQVDCLFSPWPEALSIRVCLVPRDVAQGISVCVIFETLILWEHSQLQGLIAYQWTWHRVFPYILYLLSNLSCKDYFFFTELDYKYQLFGLSPNKN